MKAVRFHDFGDPSVLVMDNVADPVPAADEVLVRIEAAGVNHLDLDVRAGISRWPVEPPHIPGTEFAGEVVACGADAAHLPPGTRVMANAITCNRCDYCVSGRDNLCREVRNFGLMVPGSYAQLVAAPARSLIPIPDGLSFEAAAVAQLSFGTAWHMLVTRGRLRPGETVLINAAASSVGVAAVQIARLVGARVIASAGRDEKLERVRELGADELVNYSTSGLADEVLALTGGEGVDLAFEHVGGELFADVQRLVRRDGRIVTCGAHAGEVVDLDLVPFFRREIQLIGCRRASTLELKTVLSVLAAGRVEPVIHARLALDRARESHEILEARSNTGKLVLLPQEIGA